MVAPLSFFFTVSATNGPDVFDYHSTADKYVAKAINGHQLHAQVI